MSYLVDVIIKEIKLIFTNKYYLFLICLWPFIDFIFLGGIYYYGNVQNMPIAIIDKDHSKKRHPKEDNEDSTNNSSVEFERISFKKQKKIYSQKKAKIDFAKYFKEDGEPMYFPLFKEKEININEYDNKVKIESAEDDFESDESTLEYGRKRVEEDLIGAFSIIKKENINCLINYRKYSKIIKKPKGKLNLKKNLPNIPETNKINK